jgi:hypothetical protein
MDVAAGFTTGFSFDYVSLDDFGSVDFFSGLDRKGTLLAPISLTPAPARASVRFSVRFRQSE